MRSVHAIGDPSVHRSSELKYRVSAWVSSHRGEVEHYFNRSMCVAVHPERGIVVAARNPQQVHRRLRLMCLRDALIMQPEKAPERAWLRVYAQT